MIPSDYTNFNSISKASSLGGQSNILITKMSGYMSTNLIFIVALFLFLFIAGYYYYYYVANIRCTLSFRNK